VLAPSLVGGLESVVKMLLQGWVARGGSAAVALALEPGEPVPAGWSDLESLGVRVLPLPIPHRSYLRERRLYADAIRDWKPDVVHCHGYRPDILAGWAAHGLGVARVSTVHGFTGVDWKNRLYETFQIRALAHFDGVIAVSRSIVSRLVAAGVPQAVIALIPNALQPEPALPREAARRELGLPAGEPVLGWVGRLSPEKGPDVLIDALPELQDLPVKISLIGDGRLRGSLEEQARRIGVADRVRFHGVIPGAARLYSAFDGFVLSSRTEGTPIALLEAMAAEVPIVATTVGGVPDVIGIDEGLLIPPEDPVALATGIRAILENASVARARAIRARLRVARDFAATPWIERHVEFYNTVLARIRRPRA